MTQMGVTDYFGDGEKKKLEEGALVEVRMTETGLRGSWHPALVMAVKPGKRVVVYEELVSDDDSRQKLKETIPVGRGVDGLRASSRQFGKASSSPNRNRILLRPRPPILSNLGKASWRKGLWVDAFWRDAWWEGILAEDILSDRAGAQAMVYFPDEGGLEICLIKDLRLRQEWDEETGNWSLKGRAKFPQVQDPYRRLKKEPESAVRVLNFDEKVPFFGFTDVISTKVGGKESCRRAVELATAGQRLTKKLCPDGRMASPDSSPAYSISNLLKGLEAARDEVDIAGSHDFLAKEQDCNRQTLQLLAAPGTKETTSQVITTGSEPTTTPFCNGKSNHQEEDDDDDPTLIPDSPIELSNPPPAMKSRVLQNGGKKTVPEVEEAHLENMTIAKSVKTSLEHQVLNPESSIEKTSFKATESVKGVSSLPCSGQDESTTRTDEDLCSMHAEEEEEEEAADDETLETVLIEHRAQIRKLRVMNGKENHQEPHGMRSRNIRNAMVLRNRQCKLMLRDSSEHARELVEEMSRRPSGVFSITGEKSCRKRAFNSHCSSLEITQRRKKKNRWRFAYEESTTLPYLPPHHEEPVVGNLGVCKVSSSIHEWRCKKKGVRGGCRMEVLLSQPEDPGVSGGDLGKNFCTKKNTLSWLIDAGILCKDQKLHYMHRRKELGVGGRVSTEGVLCGCCNNVVTLSTFETHCGSRLHHPCANIFVEDGKSIAALQIEALKKQMSSVRTSSFHKGNNSRRGNSQIVKEIASDVNDDTCGVCGDGGMLICCDHCPSTFHLKCMELTVVPEEDWYCPNCRCAICGLNQFNGSHETFDKMSVLFCDQCEREFHVKCLYMRGMPKMEQYPQDSWFCGSSCERIYRGLRGLVGINNSLGKGFSWTLLRSQDEDPDPKIMEVDKELLAEQNIKLSIALSVMQECFRPMIDPRTKVDVIAHALYNRGSNVNRLNYHGFYTIILEKGDELISVAAIRVHGAVLAEMPLIGTRFQYRRQGMCRRLMRAIEQMLQTLGVETLVLPAVPELLETWIGAFGFQPMDTFPKQTLIELNLMAFPGTSLLHKSLARLQPVADEKTKMCGIKKSQQLSSLKGGLLSKGTRVKQRRTSARVGVSQLVSGKVSDESMQETEIPGTFPIRSDRILESSCVGDENDEQVPQSSTANLDSSPLAEATIRELADSLMDEHVQQVLEQVIDSDEEFSSKLGSDVLDSPPCNEEDNGSKIELLQHRQHSGFQEDRHPEKGSTGQKQEEADAYRTKVVVATTRYNRQVKTSQWIADAMKKLRGNSSMRTCASPVQTHLCSMHDLCKPIVPNNLSEDKQPPIDAGEALPPVNLQCTVESSRLMRAETAVCDHVASLSEPESLTQATWLCPSV